ncbi:hypothetical protein Mnod_1961 [Methylobacterium nodulans ORS 2060]|uniref:Uncharacterized protein n=1 Tax=Methylobacterium nodulans (strain LMG 21967 / CNCM I-2342 / ORS 2060) TaxID=460265 RepID=B8IT64_METNO|nr:hypothetical protein Mnod_1961 [Methylobacterium nodulans ORS 2060]
MPDRGYAVRKGREGWGVYAQHTGEPVRVNGRVQTGPCDRQPGGRSTAFNEP